jgi:hypothetical protein
VPGLEGLTLTQDYLDGASRRARERPGWAGVQPVVRSRDRNGRPPTHWAQAAEQRPDVMPATSEVERREEERMASRIKLGRDRG